MNTTDITLNSLYESLVNWGADPFILEDEESKQNVLDFIQSDEVCMWEVTEEEEFATACSQLDLDPVKNNVKHIYKFAPYNSEALLICFGSDWDYAE